MADVEAPLALVAALVADALASVALVLAVVAEDAALVAEVAASVALVVAVVAEPAAAVALPDADDQNLQQTWHSLQKPAHGISPNTLSIPRPHHLSWWPILELQPHQTVTLCPDSGR